LVLGRKLETTARDRGGLEAVTRIVVVE